MMRPCFVNQGDQMGQSWTLPHPDTACCQWKYCGHWLHVIKLTYKLFKVKKSYSGLKPLTNNFYHEYTLQ